jgi:CubicO group peptidase (beta-lactamase class C family)
MLMAPPGTYPIQKVMEELGLAVGPPAPDEMPAPDEWLRRLGTLPLLHHPGERWMYHTGSEVLSVLIARAVGEPLPGFLRARIFEPLGMNDTGFYVPPDKIDRLATSFWTNFQTGEYEIYDLARGGQWSRPPAFPSGGGGLVSTADDYLAFAQMLMNKGTYGGERLLSRAAVELMTMDHLTDAQKAVSGLTPGDFDAAGWGLGVGVVTRKTDLAWSPGTYGWDGGLGTSWRNDPAEGLTGILLTQRMWTSPTPPNICRDFWTLTYGAIAD